MADYVSVMNHDKSISIAFYVEKDKIFDIGKKMQQIKEEAYMNGYNWEVFFDYYLSKCAPDILVGLEHDPEAGMYAAYYDLTPENEKRAEKFKEIICSLVENEDEIYKIIHEKGNEIMWE